MTTRTIRTLFSGGDLFGVGARRAGYTHLDGWEIAPAIASVARLNGFDVRVANVCDVPYETLPPADHLHASPSCKNASQAKQKGRDADGEPLPRETPADLAAADAVCRAIAAHEGETVTLENVWNYRTFVSFGRICAALAAAGFSCDYWHLNAADYGVPQTRKRLILIARRGLCRIQRPHPTHREGGDMFHAPWNSWYAAIEDILHTLPSTRPAPWQESRMPKELRETMLIGAGGYDGGIVQRPVDMPAFTVAHGGEAGSTGNSAQIRGYIVASNSNPVRDGVFRPDDEPAHTTTTNADGRVRALLLDGQTGNYGQCMTVRAGDDPAFTMRANSNDRQVIRALLISGENASRDLTIREADDPSFTVRATRRTSYRAGIAGRWVRMTIQALGRFQTVPDSYQGLTSEINGNGVPCLLAQRVMESLL